MIVLAGLGLGAFWGVQSARKRGGNRMDMAQYGTVYAILFGLVGLFATIGLEKVL
jgi:hypothetical protein